MRSGAAALEADRKTAGTIGGMVKTTVYLDDRDAAALRRMAAESGRSQAEIIREAISRTTQAAGPRRLRSAGVGRGSGAPIARNADEIVREELGRSAR
jgi:Arc/MetJ-type ribon-helix-helix transcriptional regulator